MTLGDFRAATSHLSDDMEMVIEKDHSHYSPCVGTDTNHVRFSDRTDDFEVLDTVNHQASWWGIEEEEEWERIIRKPKVLLLRTKQVNPFE